MSATLLRMLVLLCATAALTWTAAARADDQVRVVYHITDTDTQASFALGNIRNHLRADPTAKIVVVALYKGINFLVDGATDARGNPFILSIEELADKGVEFRVCKNSMDFLKVEPGRIVPQGRIVPSGVAEIARLQAVEHYAYIRP